MPVDLCICHNITFAKLKCLANEKGLKSIEEIRENGLASTKCKLCEPYVKELLTTGETSFKPGLFSKNPKSKR